MEGLYDKAVDVSWTKLQEEIACAVIAEAHYGRFSVVLSKDTYGVVPIERVKKMIGQRFVVSYTDGGTKISWAP